MFKYHATEAADRMKPMRLIWQSYSIVVGIAIDELNLECNGKMNGMKSQCTSSVLKCGVY